MHADHIFLLLCALCIGNVICDCAKNSYIDCFSDVLREFFGSANLKKADKTNVTQVGNKTLAVELSDNENFSIDKVLLDLTSLIKEIDGEIKESELINRVENKTKIVVKTFEKYEDLDNTESTEKGRISTTNEADLYEDVSLSDIKSTISEEETTTASSFQVIPLENNNVIDNEIFNDENLSYSDAEELKFVTDYPDIDYIEIYKDTTNEPFNYVPTEAYLVNELTDLRAEIDKQEKEIENLISHSLNTLNEKALEEVVKNVSDHSTQTSQPEVAILKDLVPWIATVFLKNETGDQFDYYCDGALVSDKVVLTAARCVRNGNGSFPAENFIVILGKTSLQISGGNEKILRVKQVKYHENFTIEDSIAKNDLALLTLEEPVIMNQGISVASLRFEEDDQKDEDSIVAVTTAWGVSGDIALIYFDKEKSRACESNNKVENTFCATYGDDVALCPSYGGLYVTKQGSQLCLAGIRTGDPTDRGICFNKNVNYTALANHTQWISESIEG